MNKHTSMGQAMLQARRFTNDALEHYEALAAKVDASYAEGKMTYAEKKQQDILILSDLTLALRNAGNEVTKEYLNGIPV